jgi:hypothetical protein
VSDTLELFNFNVPNNMNWYLSLDIITLPQEKSGIIYLILIDPNGQIYSAPNWKNELSPLTELTFPPNLWLKKIFLGNINSLKDNWHINVEGIYTLAIAAFDPENMELISNVETIELQLRP